MSAAESHEESHEEMAGLPYMIIDGWYYRLPNGQRWYGETVHVPREVVHTEPGGADA